MDVVPEDETLLAANDSGGLEFGGDAARGISRAQHHESLRRRFGGYQQCPGEPARAGKRRNHDEPEDLAHYVDSLEDEGERA